MEEHLKVFNRNLLLLGLLVAIATGCEDKSSTNSDSNIDTNLLGSWSQVDGEYSFVFDSDKTYMSYLGSCCPVGGEWFTENGILILNGDSKIPYKITNDTLKLGSDTAIGIEGKYHRANTTIPTTSFNSAECLTWPK